MTGHPSSRNHSPQVIVSRALQSLLSSLESLVEMKTARVNRLDAIKQAILLFVNSKLSINPDHRFSFATLSKFAYWHIKEFNSDVESMIAVVRALSATTVSSSQLDLTNLFRLAAHEAKKSYSQNRILRVVLRYQNCVQNLYFTFLFVLRAVTKDKWHMPKQ
ncbi:hypothetical protein V6N13_056969 [Hibiscus sabdariffa]|uniref:BRISC and BRCA1-A complex member 1 n=1 Tax=Hibiscus sabdariffa TaxID=183260 RepID=A0ABR1ZS66_9ROSI